jgi:hypothetical protein
MDAELCIALRPDWFRGWLRAALALSKLNVHSAALACINEAFQVEVRICSKFARGCDFEHYRIWKLLTVDGVQPEHSELQDALDLILQDALDIIRKQSGKNTSNELQDALDIIRKQSGKNTSSVATHSE